MHLPFFFTGRQVRSGLIRYAFLLAALATVLLPSVARATATCTGKSRTFTVTMPASISVPRDLPVGSGLTPWVESAAVKDLFHCSVTNSSYTGVEAWGTAFSAYSGVEHVSEDGTRWGVYKTNVPGVGLTFSVKSYRNGCGWNEWGRLWRYYQCSQNGDVENGAQLRFRLVKTAKVVGNGTVDSVVAATVVSSPYMPGIAISYQITSTRVTALACFTPDVTVDLGTHRSTDFKGVGSVTAARNFAIRLQGCPAGMNQIRYRIDAATPVLNKDTSVVALDDGFPSAGGVGVQLLDRSGNAFPLGTAHRLSGYNGGSGGDYDIDLSARLYQTGASVQGGPVKASMVFTMAYE